MKNEAIVEQPGARRASFYQKSAGVSLVLLLATSIYTALRLVAMAGEPATLQAGAALPTGFGTLVAGIVLFIVVMEIVLQALLAIGSGGADTRSDHENAATLRAHRPAYLVLFTGMLIALASLFLSTTFFAVGAPLLMALLAAETVKAAGQLYYSGKSMA